MDYSGREYSRGQRSPRPETLRPSANAREMLQARLYGTGSSYGGASHGSLPRQPQPPGGLTGSGPLRQSGVGATTGASSRTARRPQRPGVSLVPKLRMSAAVRSQRAAVVGTDPSPVPPRGSSRSAAGSVYTPRRPDGSVSARRAASGRPVPARRQPTSARVSTAYSGAGSAAGAGSTPFGDANRDTRGHVTFREDGGSAGPAVEDDVGVGKLSRRALLLRAQQFRSFMDNIRDTPGFSEASIYGDGFVYLAPQDNNVYNLRVTDPSDIDPRNYFTLSQKGITHFCGDESEFTSIHQYEREYYLYNMVCTVKVVLLCRAWGVHVAVFPGVVACRSLASPSSKSIVCGRRSWYGRRTYRRRP